MGEHAFKQYCAKNEAVFKKACRKEKAAHQLRQQKRARRRSKLETRNRALATSDDSDDDIPLMQQRRAIAKTKPQNSAITASQEDYYDLFVGSQDPSPLGPPSALDQQQADLPPRKSPVVRKAPLEQSSTEEEEGSASDSFTDDSLLGELADKTTKKVRRQTTTRTRSKGGPDLGNSILSPKSTRRKDAVLPLKPVAESSEAAASGPQRQAPTSALKRTLTSPAVQASTAGASNNQNARRPSEPAMPTTSTTSRKDGNPSNNKSSSRASASTATFVTSSRTASTKAPSSTTSTTSTAIKRSGTSSISVPRILNEPPGPGRTWTNSDRPFRTLQALNSAGKRSRTEPTPDFAALRFVGPVPPSLLKSRASNPADNLYGRREAGTRRMQEVDVDERSQQKLVDEAELLRYLEAEKAPLVCPHWRLSNNCPYGPVKCNFLHRNQDKHGRDLPVGDVSGRLPPKYRKPPLTCPFWLTDKFGCRKSDAECAYAHRNTGWIPKDANNKDVPFQIDVNVVPVTEQSAKRDQVEPPDRTTQNTLTLRDTSAYVLPKYRDPALTCPYWLYSPKGCTKADTDCKYAHRNTGWAPKDKTQKEFPVRIDPNMIPKGNEVATRPVQSRVPGTHEKKNTKPPPDELTCWFWTQNNCNKTPEQCTFQHWDTGIVADPPPSFATCRYWLEGNCYKTAEECTYQHYHMGTALGQPHHHISTFPNLHESVLH